MMHLDHRWHTLSKDEVARLLKTDCESGLTSGEARRRLQRYGPNKLAEKPPKPKWLIFLQQFQDFMVMVLLVATAVSALLGEIADAAAIAAIVMVNAVLGYMQEAKAEASLAALKQLTAPRAKVLRDKRIINIRADELVPGDIVEIESGDRIPADIRLISATSLAANESPLTGESLPVSKSLDMDRGRIRRARRSSEYPFHGHYCRQGTRSGHRSGHGHEHTDRGDRRSHPTGQRKPHAFADQIGALG